MYLLYLDESGSIHSGSGSDYFVIGGVAVHEQDAWPLAQAVERIANQLPDPVQGVEFHASPMRSGSGKWRRVPRSTKVKTRDDLAQLLANGIQRAQRPPVLFAVALHVPSFPHQNPYERAYEEFLARCNGFIGRLASANDYHRCIAISDESKHLEAPLQRIMREWRLGGSSTGARIKRMASYAEVPLFVDSKASRLIQLADFVAHWVYRSYESQDHEVFNALLNSFDQEDLGPIYGLVHLVSNYQTCPCPACVSRR